MGVLDDERKKLQYIQKQYQELIAKYNEQIKRINEDYKNDPYIQASLLEQCYTKLNLLKKTINSPFFGRIDFLKNNEKQVVKCYIGKVGVVDDAGEVITVDWRAPIATLYYDSNLGKTKYIAPEGVVEGELKLKRQFEMQNGSLISFQDVDTVTNDELLKPFLSANMDRRLKNIVSTIQSEQNFIIRKTIHSNSIIQGAAGSGKTTVALHRAAYLVYNEQKQYNENQFIVIGPNKYFMDYISSVLPDLDVNAVIETTFLDIVNDFLNEKIKIVNQNEKLETILNSGSINQNDIFKSSLEYRNALNLFIQNIESSIIHGPILIEDVELFSENDILRFLSKKSLGIMERIKEFSKYAKNYIKNHADEIKHSYWMKYREEFLSLPKDSSRRQEIIDKTTLFNTTIDKGIDKIIKSYFENFNLKPVSLYRLFINNIERYVINNNVDLISLKEGTLKAIKTKIFDYNDLPALVYLNLAFNGYKGYDKFVHVIIDEAQDFSLFHFDILKSLFKNSTFSIFGDLAQSIYSYQSIENWDSVINQVFDNEIDLIKMEKSYRTTYEIMKAANMVSKLFGYGNAEAFLRHGDDVKTFQIDYSNIVNFILDKVNALYNDGYQNIAIICKDENEVNKLAKVLNGNMNFNVIDLKSNVHNGNLFLVSSYLSKGLEFDAVIIWDVEKYNPKSSIDMKLLYVAMTRALHHLDITYENDVILPLQNLKNDYNNLTRKYF